MHFGVQCTSWCLRARRRSGNPTELTAFGRLLLVPTGRFGSFVAGPVGQGWKTTLTAPSSFFWNVA